MTIDTIQFEAIKMGLRQSKDGYVLSLAVHPSDIPDDLVRDYVGSRYMVVMVKMGDDEAPIKRKQNNYVQIAGLLCRDKNFQNFLNDEFGVVADCEEHVAYWICEKLGIDSRSELPNNPVACEELMKIKREYEAWKT
jgi:hypothetical protein